MWHFCQCIHAVAHLTVPSPASVWLTCLQRFVPLRGCPLLFKTVLRKKKAVESSWIWSPKICMYPVKSNRHCNRHLLQSLLWCASNVFGVWCSSVICSVSYSSPYSDVIFPWSHLFLRFSEILKKENTALNTAFIFLSFSLVQWNPEKRKHCA